MEMQKSTAGREYREAVPILRQLWTEQTPGEVVDRMSEERYRAFSGFVDGDLVGVAGVVVEGLFHHVRHAWLYDLVVDEPQRGEGYGSELVAFVEAWAAERDSESVTLASPLGKAATHGYYQRRGYETWGYVVEKEL